MSHPIDNDCPNCGAIAGAHCVGRRGPRKAFHRARGYKSAKAVSAISTLRTDSPIERVLVNAITEWLDFHEAPPVIIRTQVNFGPYRADIMVYEANRTLVVECDGKSFHNTTSMIEHDKRRDRYCAVHGMAVMRFTGDEIRRDVRGCAAQVGAWIRRAG